MKEYSDIKYLLDIIGKKLKKILVLIYLHNGEIDQDPIQEIQFEFEELNLVRLFCGSDGLTICWNNGSLKPIDMGECGELRIFNLSNSNILWSDIIWKDLIDKKIKKVYLVTSKIRESVFAVKFIFSNNSELVIANLGDELRIQKQLIIEIIDEESSKFIDIEEIFDIKEIKYI